MICPKCAFSQPDDIYCANCGVNVEKYLRKQKKGRFKIWAVVAFLAVAALTIAKFTSTGHHPAERPPEKEQANKTTVRTTESPVSLQKEPRSDTPEPESLAKRIAPRRQTTPTPSIEQPTTKTGPQSDSKEGNLTARELFEKGLALDDDSDKEIDFYQKAIELDPSFAPAYYRLGAIYFRQADYDLSAEHFVKFLQYGSDEDKRTYNVELYFSAEDLEALREAMEETAPKPESQEAVAGPKEGEAVGKGEEVAPEPSEGVESIIRFSASSGHMTVPAVLNGSNNSTMLFDTGAGITVLSRDLAQSLGLKMEPGKSIKLRTVAANVQAQMATLDSITVGDFTKTNFPVAVVDLGSENNQRFDGILGMDFLSTYTIRIDNQTSSIFLSPKK
jgi:clan AA aspartic protease (TIGR02281 family)